MGSYIAKCIKETYIWDGDGQPHKFSKVKKGHIYSFYKENGIYWIDPQNSVDKADFMDSDGFIEACARGLEEKLFKEMFVII